MLRRKWLSFSIACIVAICVCFSALAGSNWYCPLCGRLNDSNFCPNDATPNPLSSTPNQGEMESGSNNGTNNGTNQMYSVEIWGLATAKLATRSGPSTEFTEPGTFRVENTYVRIITIAYDVNNVPWVQCEIDDNGSLMRVYTGLKRFDKSTFDVGAVPVESDYTHYRTYLSSACTLQYGPGYEYAQVKGVSLSCGKKVTVTNAENGWVQIQYELSDGKLRRGWVPSYYVQ